MLELTQKLRERLDNFELALKAMCLVSSRNLPVPTQFVPPEGDSTASQRSGTYTKYRPSPLNLNEFAMQKPMNSIVNSAVFPKEGETYDGSIRATEAHLYQPIVSSNSFTGLLDTIRSR